jgi:hypothetical protein
MRETVPQRNQPESEDLIVFFLAGYGSLGVVASSRTHFNHRMEIFRKLSSSSLTFWQFSIELCIAGTIGADVGGVGRINIIPKKSERKLSGAVESLTEVKNVRFDLVRFPAGLTLKFNFHALCEKVKMNFDSYSVKLCEFIASQPWHGIKITEIS